MLTLETGQVLVRVEAAGVGVALVRSLPASGASSSSGGEIVGTVADPGDTAFRVGERVGGVVFAGAFDDLVAADARLLTSVPAGVGPAVALTLVRGGLIALATLRAGRFATGESVLVTAAASGVGHLAVQLARSLGASRVVAAVGSADKAAFVRSCGATEVVTYDEPGWGDPVDVVLDGVGGEVLGRGVAALAPFGRLVAFSAGGGTVDASELLSGARSVVGFTIGALNRAAPRVVDGYRERLWEMLAAGRIAPAHVDFPRERLDEAVELVRRRANLGRVVSLTGARDAEQH